MTSNPISFPQFARLPAELRLIVWDFALRERRRLIAVHAISHESPQASLYSTVPLNEEEITTHWELLLRGLFGTSLPEQWKPGQLSLVVEGVEIQNTILQVNQESRKFAFNLYRVRVPCLFRTSFNSKLKPGILLFSPELDLLYIQLNLFLRENHFLLPNLYFELKTRDPRGVGVCNLVFGSAVIALHSEAEIDPNDPQCDEKLLVFNQVFSRLKSFYHVEAQTLGLTRDPSWSEVRWDSHPLFPYGVLGPGVLQCDKRDPRILPVNLNRIWIDGCTGVSAQYLHKSWHDDWQEELSSWNLHPESNRRTDLRLLLTIPYSLTGQIHPFDMQSGRKSVLKKDSSWYDKTSSKIFEGPLFDPECFEQRDHAVIDNPNWRIARRNEPMGGIRRFANGFWLLPLSPNFASASELTEEQWYDMPEFWPQQGQFCFT